MRKAAVLLACLAVFALLLAWKKGGLGGQRGRSPSSAGMPTDGPAPQVPAPAPPLATTAAPKWRAVGNVTGPTRGSVEIVANRGGWLEPMGRGEVIDGQFAIDLPALDTMPAFLRRCTGVRAAVVAAGFVQPDVEFASLSRFEPGEVRLDVTLDRGAAVRGRVIEETGRAVAGADVYLSPDGVLGNRTDADGAFVVPVTTDGARWLCASKFGIGVAAVGPLQLSTLADLDAGDLVLRGPGRLSGMAVYPDGTPVREMRLNVAPAMARATAGFNVVFPFDPAVQGVPDGLRGGWTITDSEGRFLIRGLRSGRYLFLEDKEGDLLETGSDVRVVIDRYRILVRVVDENGVRVRGIRMAATNGEDTIDRLLDDLPVSPGDRWTFSIGDLDLAPQSVTVDVVASKREYEARLVARPVTATGRVQVVLTDPRGAALPAPHVDLYAGGLRIQAQTVDALGQTDEVPVGDYRLVAMPKDGRQSYLPAEAHVTVRAGAITPLKLAARSGGRLRVTLKGGPTGEKLPEVSILARPAPGMEGVALVPFWNQGRGYRIGSDTWSWETPTTGFDLLVPGSYALQVTVRGYEPATVPVTIHPDAVTDAQVALAPAK